MARRNTPARLKPPAKPAARLRAEVVSFRLTAAELEHIRARAERAGTSLADYARKAMLRRRTRRHPGLDPMSEEALAQLKILADQVRRVGVNINQIAHQLNAQQLPAPAQLESVLEDIRRYMIEVRARDPAYQHR